VKHRIFKCHHCQEATLRPDNGKLHFCDNKCKSDWQKTKRPVTREWLIEHYINQKMDCVQIGKIVNRDPTSVHGWMIDFGIPTRKRGTNGNVWNPSKGTPNPFKGRKHSPEARARMSAYAKSVGRVPYDPKVGSYMKGRKGSDTPNWKGGITAERQAVYSSLEWKSAVSEVWKRDNATCRRCLRRKNEMREVAFDIHHIRSFQCVELRCTVSNLVLLCDPCHYWVHSKANKNKLFICP
jgi:hypothetical protein